MAISRTVEELEFVLSRDELPYEEVLNDFCHSAYIGILTYNISENHDSLLERIRKLDADTEVEIITNIPGRFETYFGDGRRETARKKIRVFMNKLNPEAYAPELSTFFCFNNHSKIIMTNNIAYIGSANFSEDSVGNFEAGFITRDSCFIQFLRREVFPFIRKESEGYFDHDSTFIRVHILDLLSRLANIKSEMHDVFFTYLDSHHGEGLEVFNLQNDILSLVHVNGLKNVLYDIECLISILETDYSIKHISLLEKKGYCKRIQDLLDYGSNIYLLAEFSTQNYIDDFLESDSIRADDEEHVNKKINIACEEAMSVTEELSSQAKEDIYLLESLIDDLLSQLEVMRREMREVLRPNPNVDNT